MTREQNAAVRRQISNAKIAITPEKIMQIAVRKGGFSVDWQYRNDWLMSLCKRMCRERKLYMRENNRGSAVFVPSREYLRAMREGVSKPEQKTV